jgi:hypothetical protein
MHQVLAREDMCVVLALQSWSFCSDLSLGAILPFSRLIHAEPRELFAHDLRVPKGCEVPVDPLGALCAQRGDSN